jgi:hypothetical protein
VARKGDHGGRPYCFINHAVMVFMELANAYSTVTMPP